MSSTLYYNGTVITVDPGVPDGTALLVRDGKIQAVGEYQALLALRDRGTKLVNLEGKTILPGFVDAHSHITMAKLFPHFSPPPVGEIDSIPKLVEAARQELDAHPPKKGKWFVGMGYDNAYFPDSRHPTRHDLDAISATVPIALIHVSAHVGVLNTLALKEAGITADSAVEGGVIHKDPATGEPTGLLEERALTGLLGGKAAMPSFSAILRSVREAQDLYAQNGITTAQDGAANPSTKTLYRALGLLGGMKIDVYAYMLIDGGRKGLEGVDSRDTAYHNHFRVAGAKLLLDGSPQAKTAWLTQPYYVTPPGQDPDYRGYPVYEDDGQVLDFLKDCLRHNWQVLCHCNGDAAGDQFVGMYRRAMEETGIRTPLRPVMIHAQTVREDQLDQMKEIGMYPSFFHDHTYYWGDYHLSSVLGPQRGERISPLTSALARGMSFTLHQDTPVVQPNMLFSIWSAVNRITAGGREIGPQFRVGVMDAIRAVTIHSAFQCHEEAAKGSLTPGKLADLVILDRSPLETPAGQLKDIRVMETVKEGRTIYRR